MKSFITLLAVLALGSGAASAINAPADPSRRSVSGFGGWLVLTKDADWEKKWSTPQRVTPSFTISDEVRLGETLNILIFYANPKVSAQGAIDIRCEIKVTRPDGSAALDEKNLDCASGPISGPVTDLRLSGNTLQFVGEPADPPGTWTIEVTLQDVNAKLALPLKAQFEMKAAGK